MNHPNRKHPTTIRVVRMYNHDWRPNCIWHIDGKRVCTADELHLAMSGGLRMVEDRRVAGHPSYGHHKPGEGNYPSHGRAAGEYVLSPANIAEFASH